MPDPNADTYNTFANAHRYPGGFDKWAFDMLKSIKKDIAEIKEELNP